MQPQPAALEPVAVEKPWGREVWYSGVEARGESRVRVAGGALPLSRYLRAHGRSADIVLLKALQPNKGDLYMEVHDAKWEVYAVDEVDEALWPRGGQMLLGANQSRRAALGEGFRAALLEAAQRAESAGRQGGTALADVAGFLNAVVLRPGDMVAIPPRMPHSLRRGVSVIEFQTPVFERKILAASQPVATQNGWDSAAAAAAMNIDLAPDVRSARRMRDTGETIRSADFSVVALGPSARRVFRPWAVGWVQRGEVRVNGVTFGPRTAFVAPTQVQIHVGADAWALVAEETSRDVPEEVNRP